MIFAPHEGHTAMFLHLFFPKHNQKPDGYEREITRYDQYHSDTELTEDEKGES